MNKVIFIICSLCLIAGSCTKTVYLDELDTKLLLQDWGYPVKNKSIAEVPFLVAGQNFERGIGTHSISRFLLNLDGKAKSFSGFVGADDVNHFNSDMEFKLIADKKEIWSSGIMRKGMTAKEFKVSLKGVQKLALVVAEAGDGIMYDHANWLEAKFETYGDVIPENILPTPIKTSKYILTPPPVDTPRINSPKVFGVRPGNPFLYRVVATGKRPMTFSASQLPEGLTIDSKTGQISGKVYKRGTYHTIVRADNGIGADFRQVTIEVGDEICLTPPMGWNSWNCWGLSVDEQKVKDAADFMSRELINHGWTYINIDDGWGASERTENGILLGNEKFPDFKKMSDYIHSKGLKFGIYSSPGPRTCGSFTGSYQHEETDAQTWADWGVDYLKYDYCFYSEIAPKATENLIKEPYVVMRKALDKTNRDIVYNVGFGAPNVWYWGAEAGGNSWRTTRDITDEWNVVMAIGSFQDVCAFVTKPGRYNDPDMLAVGKLGLAWDDKVRESCLTPDEQYTHVSLWSLLSAPLLIGCDMSDMDDFTLNLLTNDEVIAVNQDPLVKPAEKIITQEGQIWHKPLENGEIAVGFFNLDPYFILWDKDEADEIQLKKYLMSVDFEQLGVNGKYKVRDLWRQKDIGVFEDSFSTEVAYHGVTLIKLTPAE